MRSLIRLFLRTFAFLACFAVSESFSGTLTSSDGIQSSSPRTKQITGSASPVGGEYYNPALTVTTGGVSPTLPASEVNFASIKNTGTNDCTVVWTPNGGASATILTLKANGGLMVFAQPVAGKGITALTLTAITASTTVDIYLA